MTQVNHGTEFAKRTWWDVCSAHCAQTGSALSADKGPTPGSDLQGLQCEETFDNESDVMTHMAEVHGGNLCIVCSKTSHCGCKKRVTELENFLYPSN